MSENTGNNPVGEIDLLEIARKLWARRRFIFKWTGVAAVVGLVVGFSIPSEYTVSVKMVAEESDNKMGDFRSEPVGILGRDRPGGIGQRIWHRGAHVSGSSFVVAFPGRYAHRACTAPKGKGALHVVRLSLGTSKNGVVEPHYRFPISGIGLGNVVVFLERASGSRGVRCGQPYQGTIRLCKNYPRTHGDLVGQKNGDHYRFGDYAGSLG